MIDGDREFSENPTGISRLEVISAYRILLGRQPESEMVISAHQKFDDLETLGVSIRKSKEFKEIVEKEIRFASDFHSIKGYSEEDVQLIKSAIPIIPNSSSGCEGFIVDFLGCKTRIDYSNATQSLSGRVFGYPVPQDWFSETIEWMGLIKSVLLARERYRILELGAGWAPWLVAGGTLAGRQGISDIVLYGVEADPVRYQYALTHLLDNGFMPESHHIYEAVVGIAVGQTLWPDGADLSADYGARPLDAAGKDYLGRSFLKTRTVPVLNIVNLLMSEEIWDLVHIDVQGMESDICTFSIALLTNRVRWLVIGTHSRKQDGDLMDLFWRAGWILEHEKPSHMLFDAQKPTLEGMVLHDGTQVWRNPHLVS